jgi:putative DNA primase/helicase
MKSNLSAYKPADPIVVGWGESGFQLPETYVGGHYYLVAGSLDSWQANVAAKCCEHSYLVLGVSLSFGGPLLELAMPSPTFHFVEPNTGEPSTLLAAAGSVLGGGGPDGFVRRWDTDSVAVDAILDLHRDSTLLIEGFDEKGWNMLERRPQSSVEERWKGVMLTSGERPLPCEHELFNLPVRDSLGSHGLIAATRRDYGWPFRHFLKHLVRENQWKLHWKLHTELDNFVAFYPDSPKMIDQFALAASAGEWATEWGITGWEAGAANRAAHDCCQQWLKTLTGDEPYD